VLVVFVIVVWALACVWWCVLILTVFFFFFFQAEDGIRDATVTGVQTCALPIWLRMLPRNPPAVPRNMRSPNLLPERNTHRALRRSEERRVGKECGSRRWAAYHTKKEQYTVRE